MRYAILGAGGIGLLLAGALTRSGQRVTLLMRPETKAKYQGALQVQSEVLGDFDVKVPAETELRDEPDVLYVATKAYQLAAALAAAPRGRLGRAVVIPMLNGIDHMDVLREAYPSGQVVAAAIRVEADRTESGRVVQRGPFIVADFAVTGPSAAVARGAAMELAAAGVTVRQMDDEKTLLWSKLCLLAPLALATSAAMGTVGAVRRDGELRDLWERTMREACAVASAEGAEVDAAQVLKTAAGLADGFGTSMQRDRAARRPTELDALAGPIQRGGRRHGTPTPATDELRRRIEAG
jgi:2-dehydropantoate 2-reductase